MRLENKSIKCP